MDVFSCLCSLLCLSAVWAELKLSVVSPRTAILGSDTLLDCTFTVDTPRAELQYLSIIWRFKGKVLLKFEDILTVLDSWASIDEARIADGNASLKLSDLMTSHEGEYTCSVIYSPERIDKAITLKLQAHPRIIIQEPAVIVGKENLLRCSVVGFYPMEISVFWSRDGQILPGSSMSQLQRQANGTFMVNSTVPIIPTDSDANHTFSCNVRHSSLVGPLQEDVTLLLQIFTEEEKSFMVMPLVLSMLVIMVIVTVLGWFLYRRLAHKEPILREIHGPEIWTIGETVELICVGHDFPKDINITWIKVHQSKETEIEARTRPAKDDMQPLLSMNRYRAESSKAGEGGSNLTLTSTLFITPRREEDEGADFKCRFFTSDHKVKEEREFKGFKLYEKPRVCGSITCIPSDEMNVQCTLDLIQFYPEEIQIKWSLGSGKLEEILSNEHKAENADRQTFDVRTECIIQEEVFNDVNFKIRVTWEHASLKAPEYKEMSVTDPDFPRLRPRLEGIMVPPLIHGYEATLQCRVAKYFPKKLHVQWLKVEKTSDGHFLQVDVGNEVVPESDGGCVPATPADGIYPPVSQFSGSAAPFPPSMKRDYSLQSNECTRHVLQLERNDGLVPQSNRREEYPLPPNGSDSHGHQPAGHDVTIHNRNDGSIPKYDESEGHPPQSNGNYERVNQINTSDDHVPQSDGCVTISNEIYGFVPPSEDISAPSFVFDASVIPIPVSDESDDDVPQSNESERPVPQSDGRDGPVHRSNKEQVNQINTSVGIVPQSNTSDWLVPQSNGSEGHPSQSNESDKVVNQINANDSSRYKSYCTNLHREPGKGYSCTACLTFKPNLHRDQGSTFICRVSHPSLQEALEQITGKLNVLSEPKVSELKIYPIVFDEMRTLQLLVHGFYPAKVTVVWTCESPGKPSVLPSILALIQEADGTYSAGSTCQLSKNDRRDITGKPITVTIEHEARREPLKAAIRLKDQGHEFNIEHQNFTWTQKSPLPSNVKL